MAGIDTPILKITRACSPKARRGLSSFGIMQDDIMQGEYGGRQSPKNTRSSGKQALSDSNRK
jgi:hypothetical protein